MKKSRSIAHLVTNDVRMDSRVRRHAAGSLQVAERVGVLALDLSRAPAMPIEGVEIVRVGPAFTGSTRYLAGRRLYRALRPPGAGADRAAAVNDGPGGAPAVMPTRLARAKTGLRDRFERRHLAWLERRFLAALERLRPDLVVCNDLDTLGAGVRHARAHAGVRVVYDSHELWPEHSPDRTPWWVEHWMRRERELVPRADACVTVNPFLAEVLSRRCGTPFAVVRNTLTREMAPVPLHASARGEGTVELVYVGAFLHGRGLPELIEAASRLPRTRLTLYGFGGMESALRAQAAALGCAERVRIHAPLPQDALLPAIAAADVGVVPYLPTTLNGKLSTPTKLYEYLAAGLAVAASDLPAIRAIVAEASAGVLFDPHDPASIASALEDLARNPAKLLACRRSARRAFDKRYNWDVDGPVYLDALGGSSTRS